MGAKPRTSLEPRESADKLGKRVLGLMRRGKFDQVVAATNELFSAYANAIGAEDPFTGSPIKGLIGYCLNFRGIAFQELGQVDDAIASFRIAADACNDYEARIGLAELLCHHRHAYDEARQIARQPILGDKLWFRKVRLDGFASLKLGDNAQAERCYRLIHEKYAGFRDDYIEAARSELEAARQQPIAEQILGWLGAQAALDGEPLARARRWWSGLDSTWQKQLRTLLTRESGRSARDAAAKREALLSDEELSFILSRKKLRLDSSYKVETLEPLTAIVSLEAVTASYWQCGASFFAPLAELSSLEELDVSGNTIEDLSFVSALSRLRVLNAGWNKISSVDPLARCNALRELHIDRNPIADIGSLQQLTELRVLDCSCRPLTSLEPLEDLSALEELSCRVHSLETASSLRALGRLQTLAVGGCRPARPSDKSLAQTRLADIGALASLARLEALSLDFNPGHDALGTLPPGEGDDTEAIAGLTSLRRLELSNAIVPSFAGLASLINLERLDLRGGAVVYPSLAPLVACPKLHSLVLDGQIHEGLEKLAELPTLRWLLLREGAVGEAPLKRLKSLRPDIRIQTA